MDRPPEAPDRDAWIPQAFPAARSGLPRWSIAGDEPIGWSSEIFARVASELLLRDLPANRIESWLHRAERELGTRVDDPWVLRAHIAQSIRGEVPIDPPTSAWTADRIAIAVMGPSGHGKSSAVAKLASAAAIHLQRTPMIIAGADDACPVHERLADYCEVMGWGYEQVAAPKLASAIEAAWARYDFVALDLPAIGIGDMEAMARWRAGLEPIAILQTHLALSATTGTCHARRMLDWYQALGPSHWLATKLDEAGGLGSFYPVLAGTRMPLGFASVGPGIPCDLQECDFPRLAHWILGDEPGEA